MKCATIAPAETRMKEFYLKPLYRSPNGTIRNILRGTLFHEPIIRENVTRLAPSGTQPTVIGRNAHGDVHRAAEMKIPAHGRWH